jgi:4,5-dihydroxyphthalate decarboxylase
MGIDRRTLLKGPLLAATGYAAAQSGVLLANPRKDRLKLEAAGYPYKHVRALIDGTVNVESSDTYFQLDKIGDLNNHVFAGPRSRAFTEIGLGPFMLAYANDNFRDYSLIPVFPLRVFRHKSIFVRSDSGIDSPSQLKGKRIATPGYSQTSLQWIRGIMQDEYGLRAEDVQWIVSAKDSAANVSGTVSKNENVFPDHLEVRTGPAGKDESELLLDGDVDALFHALEPRAFVNGDPRVRRLFKDVKQVEQAYYKKTGIFPIMHAVAIRNDLVKDNPWLPTAVFKAYSEAKKVAYNQMQSGWYFETLPWFAQSLEDTRAVMGSNFFPYGVDANRKALETLFRYSYEQGLAKRVLTIEEMFEASTLELKEA